ncbi:putative conjugative transfer protein [Escherichia coli]|nr:putative conjugative transfer protein [Escherichia coli]CAD5793584.1 putative conjugative transfer protein [Escherichia coli]CAD6049261.1 putative conjugative transfer protein [Escherichia coli]
MKVGVIRNKHAEDFRKICLLFIRLMSNVLKLFPFTMVMCSVVWFYFCPNIFSQALLMTGTMQIHWKKYGLSDCI